MDHARAPVVPATGHSRIKCGLDNVFCSHTPSPIYLGVCSRFRLPAPPPISRVHSHVHCRTNAVSSAEGGQTTRRESQSQCHACDESTQRAPHPTGSGRRKGTLRPSFQDARWKGKVSPLPGMPSRDVQLQTLISTSGFRHVRRAGKGAHQGDQERRQTVRIHATPTVKCCLTSGAAMTAPCSTAKIRMGPRTGLRRLRTPSPTSKQC